MTGYIRRLSAVLLCGLCLFALTPPPSLAGSLILPRYSQTVSLDFKNADLKDVLKAFSLQIGANFITEQTVSDRNVTVFLEKVPVEEALEKVLLVNGLAYEFDDSMNLFVVKPLPLGEDESIVSRVFKLRYATVNSSKMKGASSGASASTVGIMSAVASLMSGKGKLVEDPRTNSLIVTDVQRNFPSIEKMIARLDVPLKQVVIEVEMLDVSKSVADKMGAKFNLQANMKAGNKSTYFPFADDIVIDKYSGETTYTPGAINFASASMALDFVKNENDTRSLARPRIITMDNETATIQISTDEAIGVVQETSTESSTSTQEAERIKTGVFLTVTPQVNDMTNEITLVVEPKVIDANSRVTFNNQDYANPEERSIKVSLRVPNGNTLVIGGLLRRSGVDIRTSVPFVGKVPFLGRLFRHDDTNGRERELMVFLTPYVMDTAESNGSAVMADFARYHQDREQSFPDPRQALIDREMNKHAPRSSGKE